MKSTVVSTPEIDDCELAAESLIAQVKEKLPLRANSIGIAYADADTDVAALSELLQAGLGIDIVGLTTTATLERHEGYNEMGTMLCVLTADDVRFSVGCADALIPANVAASIKTAYTAARSRLPEDPRLILAFTPYIQEITSENYMELLDAASGGVPVFGGVATDHYDLKYQKTFYNGQAFDRTLVFLLLSGNVHPVFAMEHHFETRIDKKGIITRSEGNSILRVGDQTFKEFVEAIVPVPPNEELAIFHFQSTPVIMEPPDFEKGEQPVVRELCTINHETGAGGFLSKMPEGSAIYFSILHRDNLAVSCRNAIAGIMDQMAEKKGYEHSMIFITSCNARHLLMGDVKTLESDIVKDMTKQLPPATNAMGFYSCGEICPTGANTNGTAKNRFHNISFVACAL